MHEQSLPEQRVDAVDKNTLWKSLGSNWDQETLTSLPRKEKRKTLKKLKRKQMRRDAAEKERTEEETRLNDPAEQRKIQLMEEAEAQALQIERMKHERQEKLWLENQKKAMEEAQRKQQEELEREKAQKEAQEEEEENWEYIEEGPAEIIWQGNEIIVRKKRVRVPKGNSDEKIAIEDSNRPTSNPLPPQCAAFADYRKLASSNTSSMIFDGVEQQIPNFGTEQDKAHCPFHIKTGACRFGTRCSRAHFYPDKSCTLLLKNMYNGPGLTWEQDEGLEYTDEEVAQHYQEFYEDVHTEFLKFGEIVNFKVCRNGSAHLRGNVYVHYKSLDSAVAAYNTINGRFFAGKQITCDFIGVTRWKVAICGEYMKSRHKNCSHGSACNFLHCFRNPGGEYDWADWDSPPPRSWMIKMDTLFGRLRDGGCDYWKQRTHDGRQGHRHSDRRTQSSSNCRISRKHKVHERDSWSDDDSGATLQREHSDGGKYSSGDEKDMNSDLDEVTYHRRIDQRSQCNSRGGGGRKKREDWETSEEDRINIRRISRRNNSKTHRTKRKRHHRQQTYEEDSDGRKRTTDSSDIDLADKKCSESKSCTKIDSDHSPEHLGPWLKERDMLRRDRDKESSHDEKKRRRRPSRRGQGLIKSSNMDQDKIKSSRRSRDHSKSPRRYRDHGKSSRVHRDIKSTRRGRDGSRPQRGDEDQSISPMRDQHSIEVPKSGKDSSMIPQRICKEDSAESVDRWQASDGSQSDFGQMI